MRITSQNERKFGLVMRITSQKLEILTFLKFNKK